ncbi:MAG: FAD-binding oxidoreductase [Stappiaceae bacterium]
MTHNFSTPNRRLTNRFKEIVGPDNVVTDTGQMQPYLVEWRDLYHGNSPMVLRPGTVEEVSKVVQLANASRTAIVPQGGNTGLVGGQIPDESGTEIVVSTERLNAVRNVDTDGNVMTVEAGVILDKIHEEATAVDRMFPLTLGSQGSCFIGGNISTNAGGTAVLAYGNTRDLILGLEVVLPDGQIWNGLRALRKDNTGYDLKQLFIGAEGTLGIITAANLKLFPVPRAQEVAFIGLESPHQALRLFNMAQSHAGSMLTGFELMPRIGIEFTLRHLPGARDPLMSQHAWYVLMEISSGSEAESARSLVETLFEEAVAAELVEDAVLAESIEHRKSFWHLRHGMSEVQKQEGGSIKHDVSVPVAKVPEFLDRAIAAVEAQIPGCRPVPFGHMGDGNIHFNITQPAGADKDAFIRRWDEVNATVHGIVADLNGSISAEHGIGRLKRSLLKDIKDPVEYEMMQRIKMAFDPSGILNPGRIL